MTSLYGHNYDFVKRKKGTYSCFKAQKKLCDKGSTTTVTTTSFGSGQAAQLALLCLILAMESTMDRDGSVKWIGVSKELARPFQQLKFELREDVRMLKSMNDEISRRHLNKYKDLNGGDGNVVASVLTAVADYLENIEAWKKKKKGGWGLKPKVLEEIIKELRDMAENTGAEGLEFPWIVSGVKKPHGSFDQEKWCEERDKLERKLRDLVLRNKPLPHSQNNILRGLEAVASSFARFITTNGGNPSPPPSVTMQKKGCPRQLMAEFSLEAVLEGLLCDPVCDDKNFSDYIHGDSSQMSRQDRMKAIVDFLIAARVIPDWYRPFFLVGDLDESNFSLHARSTEVRRMKDELKTIIGSPENVERIQRQQQQKVDIVS